LGFVVISPASQGLAVFSNPSWVQFSPMPGGGPGFGKLAKRDKFWGGCVKVARPPQFSHAHPGGSGSDGGRPVGVWQWMARNELGCFAIFRSKGAGTTGSKW